MKEARNVIKQAARKLSAARPFEAVASALVGMVRSALTKAPNLPADAGILAKQLATLPPWHVDPVEWVRAFDRIRAGYAPAIDGQPRGKPDSTELALALSALIAVRRAATPTDMQHRNLTIAAVKTGALMAMCGGLVSSAAIDEALKKQLDEARDKKHAASRTAYRAVADWADDNWMHHTHKKNTKTLRKGDPNLTAMAKAIDKLPERLVSSDYAQIRKWLTRWKSEHDKNKTHAARHSGCSG